MIRELTLNQLVALDGGRVTEAWQQALGRALDDCDDRPGVDKPRTVTLTFALVPTMDEQGRVESVAGQFDVKDSLPKRSTKAYQFSPRKRAGKTVLTFDDAAEAEEVT